MVSRYIINCFKKIRLREFKEIGPKTAKAGNLVHLKTTFEVDTEATNFQELGTVMLELLHPTSAVAGMPKDAALQFLEKFEGLEREYFAGYLGPVDHLEKLICLSISDVYNFLGKKQFYMQELVLLRILILKKSTLKQNLSSIHC